MAAVKRRCIFVRCQLPGREGKRAETPMVSHLNLAILIALSGGWMMRLERRPIRSRSYRGSIAWDGGCAGRIVPSCCALVGSQQ